MNHGNDIKWHGGGGGGVRLMKEALSLCAHTSNGAEESTIINQWISSMVLEARFFLHLCFYLVLSLCSAAGTSLPPPERRKQ